ncbi:MAG: hypothetical protein WBR26_24630 [Candidatus Acidiferrum sp.]
MTSKNVLLGSALGLALFGAGMLCAQRPVENIDPNHHPNLAAAQHHLQEAWASTDAAQKANKDELGGHAEAAKHHIEEADRELKAAAEYANHHH